MKRPTTIQPRPRPTTIQARPTTLPTTPIGKAFSQAIQDAYLEIHSQTGRVVVYQTEDGAYHTIEWELWKQSHPGRFVAGIRRIQAGLRVGGEKIFSEKG